MQIETVNWSIVMEIKKAEIKDLDVVVKMKMEMFIEVGSISLLQDNAEKKIYEKYKELYQDGKGCHYLIYENDTVIACGGAVIKEDVPFCFFKTPMYGYIIDVYCVPEKRRSGYNAISREETVTMLEELIEERTGVSVRIVVTKMDEDEDFNKRYVALEELVGMNIEIDDKEEFI